MMAADKDWIEKLRVKHFHDWDTHDKVKLLKMIEKHQDGFNVARKIMHDRVLELESALEFYADKSNHGGHYDECVDQYNSDNIDEDGGYIARKALGLEIDKEFRVYNSETDVTLWKSDNKYSCIQYLEANYTGDEDDWDSIWIEEVKESEKDGR